MASKKPAAKITKMQRSLIETAALFPYVPKDMRPLFKHLIELAKHSHSVGYPKRAGLELRHARKLASKPAAGRFQVQKYFAHPTGKGGKWGNVGEVWTDRGNAEEYRQRIATSTLAGEKTRIVGA